MHDSGVLILATRISAETPELPLCGYTWCNETLKANEALHKQVIKIKDQFEDSISIPLHKQISSLSRPMSAEIHPIKRDLINTVKRNGGQLLSLADILTQDGRESVSGTTNPGDIMSSRWI
jgi:hypothetical protein